VAIDLDVARRNSILDGLTDNQLTELLPDLSPFPLPAGLVLNEPGRPIDVVHYPLLGVVSVVADLGANQVEETATVGREGMVGISAFLGAGTPTDRSLVQVPGDALSMSADALRAHITAVDGPLTTMLRRSTLALFTHVSRNAACNRIHNVRQRAARWLLMTADYGQPQLRAHPALPDRDAGRTADLGERGRAGAGRRRLHHPHPRDHHDHRPASPVVPLVRLLRRHPAGHARRALEER
jgi:CRP-like cAMP-binding protein